MNTDLEQAKFQFAQSLNLPTHPAPSDLYALSQEVVIAYLREPSERNYHLKLGLLKAIDIIWGRETLNRAVELGSLAISQREAQA